jgi:hypothetical protein
MPKSSRPSGHKRAREKAQIERNQEKQKRRMERRERKASAGPRPDGEDPDIAGIRPGPQPRDPAWLDLEEDTTEEEDESEP